MSSIIYMLIYILLCSSDYIFNHLFMVTMHFLFLFTLIACVLLSIVSEPFSNLIETWMLIAYFYRCPSNSHGYLFNTLLCYVPTQFSTMSGAIRLGHLILQLNRFHLVSLCYHKDETIS